MREADAIFREELETAGIGNAPSQYFAVLTNLQSVGVKGDARTYGFTVALRAVTTDDFMTAEWTRLPYEVLERASSRITNEINDITRVVYDITSHDPIRRGCFLTQSVALLRDDARCPSGWHDTPWCSW